MGVLDDREVGDGMAGTNGGTFFRLSVDRVKQN